MRVVSLAALQKTTLEEMGRYSDSDQRNVIFPFCIEILAYYHLMCHRNTNFNGPVVYSAYLKMEHSDENIKFWMACESYKKIASRRSRISKAKKLYKIYIQPQSPREINIDSSTRENICRNIQEPTQTCFEEAQRIVYMHMERDSYPRFLKSEMYQKLLKTIQSSSNS
ncbi:Regulator of G-protein signaling 13 [Pteropus alecto]|uniref:Regulator of G-protein signaling 13 n=1 Tax=Pteropus alecto TaxID=9402 RepID=L5KBL3_PTEAL|nr:Regulator of G-protein signaling 13 [Pteropus alecto]